MGWLATSKQLVETHVLPSLGHIDVERVTVEMVEAWMEALSKDLARSTVVKIRSQLALAFDYGVRRRLVDWNPARIAELPPSGSPPREGRALTGSEARSLLNVAGDLEEHRLGAWITTALTLGLRPGEVSGLSWQDINVDQGLMVVHRSLAWDQNTPYLKGTKTGKVRTLDLPPRSSDALREHRKRQVEERLLMGDRWPAEWSDLAFVSEVGTPLIPSNLRRLVSNLATEAGIEGRVTPYDLRHTATSLPFSIWSRTRNAGRPFGPRRHSYGPPALSAPGNPVNQRRRRADGSSSRSMRWTETDEQILRAIYELEIDQIRAGKGNVDIDYAMIEQVTGIGENEINWTTGQLIRAALIRGIETSDFSGESWIIRGIEPQGLRAIREWPSPEVVAVRLAGSPKGPGFQYRGP